MDFELNEEQRMVVEGARAFAREKLAPAAEKLDAAQEPNLPALKELGALGYVDHMAGNPRSAISWCMVPIMLPVHLIGELAKPVSLSCRLFGNVFGEDMLLVAFTSLGVATLSFVHSPVGIPWQFPFLVLALLTSTIQALVFTVLSTIYLLLMLPHEEHGHEEAPQPVH